MSTLDNKNKGRYGMQCRTITDQKEIRLLRQSVQNNDPISGIKEVLFGSDPERGWIVLVVLVTGNVVELRLPEKQAVKVMGISI